MRYTVTDLEGSARLDQFLAGLTGQSRAKIQKLIKDGPATVNGKAATPHAPVKNGDVIEVPEAAAAAPAGPAPKLVVVYEDNEVLVIDKPAGLIVHKASKDDTNPTVVDAALAHDPSIAKVGDPERPGIVHRLDKLASGLLVIAKTPGSFDNLVTQFKEHRVEKEYLALVYGELPKESDTIRFRIDRSREKKRMIALPEDSEEGSSAETLYTVERRFATTTLVRVRITTGRTHQIRAHFHAIDHPLVGDPLYQKKHMRHIRPIPLDRVFLHATKLGFTLPGGERKTFTTELPPDLQTVLAQL